GTRAIRKLDRKFQTIGDDDDAFGRIMAKDKCWKGDGRDNRLQEARGQINDQALASAETHLLEMVCQFLNMPIHQKVSARGHQIENHLNESCKIQAGSLL